MTTIGWLSVFVACGVPEGEEEASEPPATQEVSDLVQVACDAYVGAYEGCLAEALPDNPVLLEEMLGQTADTCALFAGLTGPAAGAAAALFDCYVQAYDDGDCTSLEAVTQTTLDLLTTCA